MKVQASIKWTRRGRNTPSGNPTYAIVTDSGHTYLTERDAALSHVVEQFDPSKSPGAPAVVELTVRDGRVTHIAEVPQ